MLLTLDTIDRLPLDAAFKQHVMGEVRRGEQDDNEDDKETEGYSYYRVESEEIEEEIEV